MDPITLLLILGGAVALGGKKKKKPSTKPRECPDGFVWDAEQTMCVPSYESGPPQIHLTGLCEAWQMLPSKQAWFALYAAPYLADWIEQHQAAASGADESDLHAAAAPMSVYSSAHMTYKILGHSPLAYASEEFPDVGSVCRLPTLDEPAETPAIQGLFDYVLAHVDQAIRTYNLSGELVVPEVEG